jgi:hypothetical protein
MILNLRSKTRFLPKLAFLTARLRWRNRVSGARVLSAMTKLVDGFSWVLTVERPMGPLAWLSWTCDTQHESTCFIATEMSLGECDRTFLRRASKKNATVDPCCKPISSQSSQFFNLQSFDWLLAPKSKIKNGITYFNEFSSHQPGNPNEIVWEHLCSAFYSQQRCSRSCPLK